VIGHKVASFLLGRDDFMAKKSKREYVWLECKQCGQRNYRTDISVAEGSPKLELKKFCKNERKHTVHKVRRK
jgi:large subunit ribosomal protein L33